MILPRGITGFSEISEAPLPQVDFRKFKSACYDAAQRVEAVVTKTVPGERRVTPNFHSVTIQSKGAALSIVCNQHHPLIGFIKPLSHSMCELEFIDDAELHRLLSEDGSFRVLAAHVLDARLDDSALSDLGPAELQQIKYWAPKKLGDVIFNFWD